MIYNLWINTSQPNLMSSSLSDKSIFPSFRCVDQSFCECNIEIGIWASGLYGFKELWSVFSFYSKCSKKEVFFLLSLCSPCILAIGPVWSIKFSRFGLYSLFAYQTKHFKTLTTSELLHQYFILDSVFYWCYKLHTYLQDSSSSFHQYLLSWRDLGGGGC